MTVRDDVLISLLNHDLDRFTHYDDPEYVKKASKMPNYSIEDIYLDENGEDYLKRFFDIFLTILYL